MARRTIQADPALSLNFFNTGFYTHRSQLFAPFKGIGVNVVSFHDPVIDGNNMEDTNLYEWSRRPGFSIFCPVSLFDGEVVNQFYSARNLNGVVTAFFDSTARLGSFTNTSLTSIITKTTVGQGYVIEIGNMVYFSDGAGVDMQKWDSVKPFSTINPSSWGLAAPTVTPTVTNLGCWLPKTHFSSDNAILDPNGAVEVAFSIASGTTTQINIASAFAAIPLAGSNGSSWVAKGNGMGVLYQQTLTSPNTYSPYAGWTGFGFSIPTGSTILGVQAIISKDDVQKTPNGVVTDQSVKLLIGGVPTGTDLADTVTPWEVVPLSSPRTGGRTATYGSASNLWGNALTPAIVNSSGFGVAIAPKLTGGAGTENFPEIDQTPFPVTLIVYYQPMAGPSGSGLSGLTEPNWNTTLGSTTQDGTITWTNSGPILTWFPVTNYNLPAVVLDTNGNLQIAVIAISATLPWNAATNYIPGEIVQFGGLYWVALANSINIVPNASFSTATVAGAITTTVTYWVNVPNPITTGATAPIWNKTIGGTTSDGDYTWTNLGQGTLIEVVGTSYVYAYRTIYGHLTTASPVSLNTGSIFGPQSSGITSFQITADVVTFTGINNFIPGNTFTVDGMGIGTYLNGQTFVVLAAGLTPTSFSANFTNPNVALTSDTGNTVPLIATVSGIGTASILCNAIVNIAAVQAIANLVTITAPNNFVPGLYVTFAGLTVATWLNNMQLQIIDVDPNGEFFKVFFTTPNYPQASDTGTATFNAVEVYRVSDGGGIYLFAGAVTNPGGFAPWTLNDFTTDANLNILQIAAQNGQNDPPPGAPGSSVTNQTRASDMALTPPLGSASFASLLAGQAISSVATTVISGDLDISPNGSSSVTGSYTVGGATHEADAVASSAQASLASAIATFQAAAVGQGISIPAALGGQILTVPADTTAYFTEASGTFAIAAASTLTVNGGGIAIFICSSTLVTGASSVIAGTTPAGNIYWIVGSSATIGATNTFKGRVLAHTSISDGGGGTVEGQYLANIGSITMSGSATTITTPAAPGIGGSVQAGTITAYWQGRLWMVVGNFVYFDAGPDCTNGVPEEAWPPANRFQFAGPVFALERTADGVGLLVYLADRVAVILGGPETISFYATDFLGNFGISNPNAVFRDGSIIGQFTTQRQYFDLIGVNKDEIGEHVADYLDVNFTASKTYATMHRDGLDVGLFLSNGVDRVLRYGSNIGAWSVPAFPIFGVGALRSIETSVGITTLMLANPVGGATLVTGFVDPKVGENIAVGGGPAWINPSNITLGDPNTYTTVTFIVSATSQVLRASAFISAIPAAATIQGVQVRVVGKQSTPTNLNVTIKPTNAVLGAESHTFVLGASNTTLNFGSATDLWGMPWASPMSVSTIGFDIVATRS